MPDGRTPAVAETAEGKIPDNVIREFKPVAPTMTMSTEHPEAAPTPAARQALAPAHPVVPPPPAVLPPVTSSVPGPTAPAAQAGVSPAQPAEQQHTGSGTDPRQEGKSKAEIPALQTHAGQSSSDQTSAAGERPVAPAATPVPPPNESAAPLRPSTDLNALAHAAKIEQAGGTLDVKMSPEVRTTNAALSELSRSVVDQVVHGVSLHLAEKTSEIRIALKPESLGDVLVTVKMEDNSMHAKIDVQTTAVKTILEAHLPVLRESLSDRGVEFQRIQINAEQHSTLRDPGTPRDQHQHNKSSRAFAPDESPEAADPLRTLGYNTMEVTI